MSEKFIERYRKEMDYGPEYTEAKFLVDVLANSYSQGFCDEWILDVGYDRHIAIPFPLEFDEPCFEERLVANIMAEKCRFLVLNEDGDEEVRTPDLGSWTALLDSGNPDVEELLDTYLEGQDDAITADSLLQYWFFGDLIFS